MINRAIKHVTEQMMQDQSAYMVRIEEHLTNICTNDVVAGKLLAEGKTLKGAYASMEAIAQKMAKNNRACLPDDEGLRIIEEYYGITEEDKGGRRHATSGVIDITDLL